MPPIEHLTVLERISILETQFDQYKIDTKEIKDKLDELIQLKAKGVGALWLVSLIVGTGLFGLFSSMIALFSKPHL